MKIDKGAIRELAELLDETSLTEIEVAQGDKKIRVSRATTAVAATVPGGHAFPISDPGASLPASMDIAHSTAGAAAASHPGAVLSPMVGTAYLAAEPGKPPFVTKGASVKEGDTLMIIEAMKVMNPIKAEKSGTVKEIMVEDTRPVEFGDVLMIIE